MSRQLRADRLDVLVLGTDTNTRSHVSCWFDGSADRRASYTVRAEGPWGLVEAEAGDAFGALLRTRSQLEELGWLLAVAGARRDVWPSGMLRDWGGEEAYVLLPRGSEGVPPTVQIFDDAPADLVTTVAGQEAAHRRWCEQPK